MPTSTELDVLTCFRDAKVEGQPITIRDRVPFSENYIEMLMSTLEREGLLEWDDQQGCRVITKKGLDYVNNVRPYKELEEAPKAPKRKVSAWRYGGG